MKAKSILLLIMLSAPITSLYAEPQCKQQILHIKQSLKNLETIIEDCQKNWISTCNAAIGVNHEAILNGLDYASQICPTEWETKLNKIKEKLK